MWEGGTIQRASLAGRAAGHVSCPGHVACVWATREAAREAAWAASRGQTSGRGDEACGRAAGGRGRVVTAAPRPPGQRRKGAQPRHRPKTAVDLRPALARSQGQSQPHVITPSQRGTRALAPITKGGPLAPIPRVGCVLWSGHKLPDRHGWGRGAAAGNTRPILQHTRKEDRQAPTPGASDARTASGPHYRGGPTSTPHAVQLPRPPGGSRDGTGISRDEYGGLLTSTQPAAHARAFYAPPSHPPPRSLL